MSWFENLKKSAPETEYKIVIDFGDYSREYVFNTKKEAIAAAQDIRGKPISDNRWESIGFLVISHGFTYKEAFGVNLSKIDGRTYGGDKGNKKVHSGYYQGLHSRNHFLGKKNIFPEK